MDTTRTVSDRYMEIGGSRENAFKQGLFVSRSGTDCNVVVWKPHHDRTYEGRFRCGKRRR
ncbi:protein of unknown function [Paraburkholderia dioscoreae]|uniref:Uncharacterized protein n=1 Tax=Paraburkholderia dioscoreae TaxID=2604047 RepID=A0A5Q4ZKA1_9BURK|nr:protein of unknown function [Paraburkholderia dioscoreae]